jgi:GWxTD domain-containing protein
LILVEHSDKILLSFIEEEKMKKTMGVIALVLFFYSCASSGAVMNKADSDKYGHWLKEEVALLITDEEASEFRTLRTPEEKDKFIRLFWAKRDPSPVTEENEFKDEWYQRLEYVTRTYTRGTNKGWRSDMGKVYMFFGPPSQTRSTAPSVRDESFGGAQMDPGAQIWIYQPMPDLGLNSAFRVVFKEYQYGYDLDLQTPQLIRRALEIFPQVVIFNVDIETLPRYRYFLDKNSLEGKLIDELIASGQEAEQIALEWTPIFNRAMNKDTHVSFLIQVDPQQLDKNSLKEMTFFGKIKGEGEDEEDFLKKIDTVKEKGDKLLAVFGLPVRPGKTILYMGARGKDKDIYTLLKSDLDVPDFWTEELSTSTIILSPEVVTVQRQEGEFNPYAVGNFRATPRWGNVFKKNESLNVLFNIYSAQEKDGSVSLKIEYFLTSEEVAYRLNPQDISEKVEPGKTLAGGTQIALSPLNAGKYTFKIAVTDKNANKKVEKTVDFSVE